MRGGLSRSRLVGLLASSVCAAGCFEFSDISVCAGALVCETFESGTWDTAIWFDDTAGMGSGDIDTARAHRGDSALHVSVTPDGTRSPFWWLVWMIEGPPTELYVRSFVYLVDRPSISPQLFLAYSGGDAMWVNVLSSGGVSVHSLFVDTGEYGTGEVPIDRWTCFEWLLRSDGSVMVWIDDRQSLDWGGGGVTPMPPFETLHVGVATWSDAPPPPGPSVDVWFDDLVVDDQRIYCGD